MTASGSADNVRELRQEIEQTREQLGETVEQLAAKTDVRARARHQAAALASQLKGQASQARTQAVERARKVRDQLAGQVGGTRQPTVLLDTAARRQPLARVASAGAAVRQAVPSR
jgi:predicted Holliday junction resolvase-like endonuclease